MTGTVSWETLLWVIGSNVTVLIVAWRILQWIGAQLKDRDLKIEAEHARAVLVEKNLEEALANFKVAVAEKYATKDGVRDGMERLEQAIKEVKDLLHQILIAEKQQHSGAPRARS